MATFLVSLAIMLLVVGSLVVWAVRLDRRRQMAGSGGTTTRRRHAGDHR